MLNGRRRQSSSVFYVSAKRGDEIAEMAFNAMKNSPSTIRRCVRDKLVLANNFVIKMNESTQDEHYSTRTSAGLKMLRALEGAQCFFDQVLYLGCTSIENPKSEPDIQNAMRELNKQSSEMVSFIDVTVSIPYTSEGDVKLFDANSIGQASSCLTQFPISRILFCARGRQSPSDEDECCFAFTCAIEQQEKSNSVSAENGPQVGQGIRLNSATEPLRAPVNFACHVFRCRSVETVGQILLCFAAAFKVKQIEQRPWRNLITSSFLNNSDQTDDIITQFDSQVDFQFDVFLEIKEDDDKATYVLSPQERNCFKLRRGRHKRMQVALQQVAGPKILHVQKCFGLLLAAGRNVKHSDMHLLDVQKMDPGNDERTYLIEANWNPNAEQFEVLNTETPKDTRVYMTIATDVVFAGIQEPVRFSIECKARIYHQHERFWYVTRRALVERYFLSIRRTASLTENQSSDLCVGIRPTFEVLACESATERDRKSRRSSSDRSPSKMPANLVAPPDDDDTDSDEPLLSGSGGHVLKPCSSEVMTEWNNCLNTWTVGTPATSPVKSGETLNGDTVDKSDATEMGLQYAVVEAEAGSNSNPASLCDSTDEDAILKPGANGLTDKMPNLDETLNGTQCTMIDDDASSSSPVGYSMPPLAISPSELLASGVPPPESLEKPSVKGDGPKTVRRRPKQVLGLIVRSGVPDALRGRVWQLLAGCYGDCKMTDTYRLLLSKECPNEQVILRDIHRTFPAHEYFKDAGGMGQEALYRISKVYSLYDEDVGYCQGLSFLAASLLLHIPEEQAFCVLVKIMFDYGLRDLFKRGFEALHLRFYQLERLIEDYIPDLHQHFQQISVETHMYASQWFLTLFTAKFTLSVVFRIIDLFLCEGMYTIFHISIALLKAWKRQLMELDFEGALKYFRVVLPRKYRTEHEAQELIQQAVKLKISHKRLSKYEKEYIAMKNREVETQDPVERLEKECAKLRVSMMRLERENDDLAHELVTSKIQLRKNLDAAEDNIEALQGQVEKMSAYCREMEENSKRLLAESEQVKEMCRREIQRMDDENNRCSGIISNYKQICSDLGNRLDDERVRHVEKMDKLRANLRECPSCSRSESIDELLAISPRSENSPDSSEPNKILNGFPNSLDFEQQQQTRRLELELARTKLALVESECKNQDLCHQLAALHASQSNNDQSMPGHASSINRSGRWLKKTLSSLKDATKNTASSHVGGPAAICDPQTHHRSQSSASNC